jgi:hypothetical protein
MATFPLVEADPVFGTEGATDDELTAAVEALDSSKQDAGTAATDDEVAALFSMFGEPTPQFVAGLDTPRQNTTGKMLLVVSHMGVVSGPGENGHINFDTTSDLSDNPWDRLQLTYVACRNAVPKVTSKTLTALSNTISAANAYTDIVRLSDSDPFALTVPASIFPYKIRCHIPYLQNNTANRLMGLRIAASDHSAIADGFDSTSIAGAGVTMVAEREIPGGAGQAAFHVEVANLGGTGSLFTNPTATNPAILEAIFDTAGEIGNGGNVWGFVKPGHWWRYRTSTPNNYASGEFIVGSGIEYVTEIG